MRGAVISRLEPKYYSQEFRENENRIKKSIYSVRKLNEVCLKISDGTHFTPDYQQEGVKFYSVKDVRPFVINYTNPKFITKDEASSLDKRCNPTRGDILLTKIGATFGFAAQIESDERFQIFVSLALLRPKIETVSSKYLEIYLNTSLAYLQFKRVVKGAGVPDLHLEDIDKILIPVPTPEIQDAISNHFSKIYQKKVEKEKYAESILSEINTIILDELTIKIPKTNNRKFFISSSKQITNSRLDPYFHQAFFNDYEHALNSGKYPSVKLKKAITFIESGSRPKGGIDNQERSILSLGGEHISNYYEIETLNPKYISKEFHQNILRTETLMNDILLVKDGATTGKIGLVTKHTHVGQNINEHLFLLRVNHEVLLPEFLLYYLHSAFGQSFIKRAITGATVTGLTKKAVRNIIIPLPPLDTQQSIIKKVKAISEKARNLKIEATEEFEQAFKDIESAILAGNTQNKKS